MKNLMGRGNSKIIAVVGPTATGKTMLAAALARKFNGEIVSADSRQVFRGMDIGTGKDLKDYGEVPYHLIDVAVPTTKYNVAKYQKAANRAIADILGRGRLPIICGGTGLYADAVIYGYQFAEASAIKTKAIRTKLDKSPLSRLLASLKKADPETYDKIDKNNRRRVQRALEIYLVTGKKKSDTDRKIEPQYDVLVLGVKFPLEEIYRRIDKRLGDRLKEGMVGEIEALRKAGVSWKRLDEFGLEYRYISRYLRGQMAFDEAKERLKNEIHHFAKRQLTWFNRNKDIKWISKMKEAEKLVKDFIK